MRVCSYPLCGHAKGRGSVCRMHIFPSGREKCISWMRACKFAGSPRKLRTSLYVCSCHFVGGQGPNVVNPNPIPFEPEENLTDLPQHPCHTLSVPVDDHLPSSPSSDQLIDTLLDPDDPRPYYEIAMESADHVKLSEGNLSQNYHPPMHAKCIRDEHPTAAILNDDSLSEFGVPLRTSTQTDKSSIINFQSESGIVSAGTSPIEPSRISKGGARSMYDSFADLAAPLSPCVGMESHNQSRVEVESSSMLTFSLKRPRTSIQSQKEQGGLKRNFEIQCDLSPLSYEKCKVWSEVDFTYFTGISQTSFEVLYQFLGGDLVCSKLKYNFDAHTPREEREPAHSHKGKLFMTLVRLRRGYPLWDMSLFFKLSASVIGTIFYTWIRFMSIKFKSLEKAVFVSVRGQQQNKPDCYQPFPNLRCVVDSTEIKIQKSADMEQQSNTFSPYKGCNTVKFLIATSVYGGLSFISDGIEGNASDRKLFLKSGIMNHLNAGEAVMADRGFDVKVDLDRIGVELIIPPFLGKRSAFTSRELFLQKAIASARIHVETYIGFLKHYRLIRYVVPNTMLDILSDMVRVCAFLVNFRDPFIKWDSTETESTQGTGSH